MTGDLGTIKDKVANLMSDLANATEPKDMVVISTCLNRSGRNIVRFDVIYSDGENPVVLHRTEFNLDTFRQ